jgi:hypothetical protein
MCSSVGGVSTVLHVKGPKFLGWQCSGSVATLLHCECPPIIVLPLTSWCLLLPAPPSCSLPPCCVSLETGCCEIDQALWRLRRHRWHHRSSSHLADLPRPHHRCHQGAYGGPGDLCYDPHPGIRMCVRFTYEHNSQAVDCT